MGLGIPDMTAVVDGVHVMGRDNRGPEAHHRITQRFGGYHLRDSIKDIRISKIGGLSALAGSTKSGDVGMVVGGGISYWLGRRMTDNWIATTTAREAEACGRKVRIGLPPISIMGLGLRFVSSEIRVPIPPASITAFMDFFFLCSF